MNENAPKTVTLFADSLALPRGTTWGNIHYTATYPYLLEKSLRKNDTYKDFIFINRAERFRTIVKTEKEFEDFVLFPNSNIVIIHCGIVDCAPRVFTEQQRAWVEKLPSLPRKAILKTINTVRHIIIRMFSDKKYVSEEEFKKSYSAILQHAKQAGSKVIMFNIIAPDNELEKRSPGFQSNAKKYNIILDDLASTHNIKIIDLNQFVHTSGGHERLTTDGMHINEQGHMYAYKELLNIIARP